MGNALDTSALFRPLRVRDLRLPNRIAMSPMTRQRSPEGVPDSRVAAYYRRRAAGGTGLVISEGVAVDHPTAVDSPTVPRLHGDEALAGWRQVVADVHAAGGRIIPQLWHVGPLWGALAPVTEFASSMRPSGSWGRVGKHSYSPAYVAQASRPTAPMNADDIDQIIAAYATAARNALEIGFDGIAIHGAHGYLLDAFLWDGANTRSDDWGGSPARRAELPAAVVRAIRAAIGERTPIIYRFSQHKQQDYTACLANTPDELATLLGPLRDAGVDVFDASTRHLHQPAFAGSGLTLAGWAKELTGADSMATGSFGLTPTHAPEPTDVATACALLDRGEFDLLGIGRLHLADPSLAATLRTQQPLPTFDPQHTQGPLY